MKRIVLGLCTALALVATSGCIIAPPRHAGVVYVAPDYDSPGPGWVWEVHPRFGWGWRHRSRGWHRGWR